MGKKSRRKAGASSTKARKEKLEERRERQLDIANAASEDDGRDYHYEDTQRDDNVLSWEVGDRLWYRHHDTQVWTRGVLREKHRSDFMLTPSDIRYELKILPVDLPDNEINYLLHTSTTTTVETVSIFRDKQEWFPEFDVGDKVVCCHDSGWTPATVGKVWATSYNRDGAFCAYECSDDLIQEEDSLIYVPCGDEGYETLIQEHPQTGRFRQGDTVLFNAEEALFRNELNAPSNVIWIPGTVEKVDCVLRYDVYAVYECTFKGKNGRLDTALIRKDTDEYIASATSPPRKRLFDAIEQACSYEHINFLTTSFNLDVTSLHDLIVAKAVEHASYGALQWLYRKGEVDLTQIFDSQGNGLLNQIAKGPYALRFFQHISIDVSDGQSGSDIFKRSENHSFDLWETLFLETNADGHLFFDTLIANNNLRALSLLVSPKRAAFWKTPYFFFLKQNAFPLATVSMGQGFDVVDRCKSPTALRMLEEFSDCCKLRWLNLQLGTPAGRSALDEELRTAGLERSEDVARRFIRFCRIPGNAYGFENFLSGLIAFKCSSNSCSIFRWLISADSSLVACIDGYGRQYPTRANINEFAQTELWQEKDAEILHEKLDLVSLIAHGKANLDSRNAFGEGPDKYAWLLRMFLRDYSTPLVRTKPLAEFLRDEKDFYEYDYYTQSVVNYKLDILCWENESLDARLQLLAILIDEHDHSPPNVIDLIRWRQGGVLRWLVNRSFINLRKLASSEPQLQSRKKQLTILGEKCSIPTTITVVELLVFAAIEFDDLASLQWLLEEMCQLSLTDLWINGWNILHACAYFGRTEIAHCLCMNFDCCLLIQVPSKRKPWTKCYASHLAVTQGFVVLADFLIQMGCPVNDVSGKSIITRIGLTVARNQSWSNILRSARKETIRLLASGATSEEIEKMYHVTKAVALEFVSSSGKDIDSILKYHPFAPDGALRLDYDIGDWDGSGNRKSLTMITLRYILREDSLLNAAYIVFAVEGFDELIRWSLQPQKSTWDVEKEITVARIGAYYGFSKVVDIFIGSEFETAVLFDSCLSDRIHAAMLGAAEAGRLCDLDSYMGLIYARELTLDPILSVPEEQEDLYASLVGAALIGSLSSSNDKSGIAVTRQDGFTLIRWLVEKARYLPSSILRVMVLVLDMFSFHQGYPHIFDRGFGLLRILVERLHIDLRPHKTTIFAMYDVLEKTFTYLENEDMDSMTQVASNFLSYIANDLGFSIQRLACGRREKIKRALGPFVQKLQSEQRAKWAELDILKKGGSFDAIKLAIENERIKLSSRDSAGLPLTHIVTVYDRLDLLMWLVEFKGVSLDSTDASGRDILAVAKASGAVNCSDWVEKRMASFTISTFLSTAHLCRAAKERRKAGLFFIIHVQALHRGKMVRQKYRGQLLTRLGKTLRFQSIWGRALLAASIDDVIAKVTSWIVLKQQHSDTTYSGDIDVADLSGAAAIFGDATASLLMQVENELKDEMSVGNEHQLLGETIHEAHTPELPRKDLEFDRIELTKQVTKWLRTCDSKYRKFFVRRIEQLAAGDRSRILSKSLSGCKTHIYESYLEQKSGFRILWTERPDRQKILIWYVAKHDQVSRYVRLIDDAESRSVRQRTAASELPEVEQNSVKSNDSPPALLDPLGDTPLTLFVVRYEELERLEDASWKPPFLLTPNEAEIVKSPGTVLLLGRSGTGKTVCICSRINHDQHVHGNEESFSQLFVSRSEPLCSYVKESVNLCSSATQRIVFTSFRRLLGKLESNLPAFGDQSRSIFLPTARVTYRRFKRDVWNEKAVIDPLLAWTSILSFIKGSIESLQLRRPLTEDEYLRLGKKRCRLPQEQRRRVYALFVRYEQYRKELHLFDDCDRVTSLVYRLQEYRKLDSLAFEELVYSKVYIDEVQDYTQAEIALFFQLSGPGDLFLAGDSAQSVAEGVEFRFEDIRSVGHHLFGRTNRTLIPDKPKTVNLNFRSHSGILDVAAGVLSLLFGVFPDAAMSLGKDRGFFKGPRPAVFHRISMPLLKELVSRLNGAVVLTNDEDVSRMKRDLDYKLVYGIRDSKGLEFQTVIFANFFCGLAGGLQKPMRDICLVRDYYDIAVQHPELEGVLKLFYTGITRCIQRLFFVETRESVAHAGFLRWITTTKGQSDEPALAVLQTVENVETMTRSPDEWRTAGLDNAIVAESSSDDPGKAVDYLEKAVYCFERANLTGLARKARTHRQSALIRRKLEDAVAARAEVERNVEWELNLAVVVARLLAEGLFGEVMVLCETAMPHLGDGSQTLLQQRLLARLPSFSDVNV